MHLVGNHNYPLKALAIWFGALAAVILTAAPSFGSQVIVDDFEYTSDASAQQKWPSHLPAAAASPVTMVSGGSWGPDKAMRMTCDFSQLGANEQRCYWDGVITKDLSDQRSFSFEFYVENPNDIHYITVYFASDDGLEQNPPQRKCCILDNMGWYYASAPIPLNNDGRVLLTFWRGERKSYPSGSSIPSNCVTVADPAHNLDGTAETDCGGDFLSTGQVDGFENVFQIKIAMWRKPGADGPSTINALYLGTPPFSSLRTTDLPESDDRAADLNFFLSRYGLSFGTITKGTLNGGFLHEGADGYDAGGKMLLLPFNKDDTLDATGEQKIQQQVGNGLKLFNFAVGIHDTIDDLLGIESDGTPDQSGMHAFALSDPENPYLPPLVYQDLDNWDSTSTTPLMKPNSDPTLQAQTVGKWQIVASDGTITPTNPERSAVLKNSNGYHMTRILRRIDVEAKAYMLVSLIGQKVPDILPCAVSRGIDRIHAIGEFNETGPGDSNFTSVKQTIHARDPNNQTVTDKLTEAENLRNAAKTAQNTQDYLAALDNAFHARQAMIKAYELCQDEGNASETFRGVWSAEEGTGPYPNEWGRSLDILANNGFQAVLPFMASPCIAFFDRTNDGTGKDVPSGPVDRLAELIPAAHARGIKVYPWNILTYLKRSWAQVSDSLSDPKCGFLNSELQISSVEAQPTAPYHASPCSSRLQEAVVNTALQMAEKYEIDGIHLDYFRFKDLDSSFDATCQHDFDSTFATVSCPQCRNLAWPSGIISDEDCLECFRNFKIDVINNILKKIHDGLGPINEEKRHNGQPEVIVSAAVFPTVSSAVNLGQDWPEWIGANQEAHKVDILHPMNYTAASFSDFGQLVGNQMEYQTDWTAIHPGYSVISSIGTDAAIAHILVTRKDDPDSDGTNEGSTGGFVQFTYSPEAARTIIPALGAATTGNKIARAAELSLTMVDDLDPIASGQPVTYTITATNNGPDVASEVQVYDWWPNSYTTLSSAVPSQGTCSIGTPISCQLGDLVSQATATVTVVVQTNTADVTLQNDASVRSGSTDWDSSNNAITVNTTVLPLCVDSDSDGYGSPGNVACPNGEASDCNDNNANVHPGAEESCNGIDDDCDGSTDEGLSTDGDNDGHYTLASCSTPHDDCNDSNPNVYPGASEACNGVDDDCDGTIDEGWSLTTYYLDFDQDTYGNPNKTIQACQAPSGYVSDYGDCRDGNLSIPDSCPACPVGKRKFCYGAVIICGCR